MVWSALIGAGATLGAGLLGAKGQRDANRQNLAIAREQMAFQERMSSTAYQRATKDLEKSGLNRILALGSPASSPGGASAVMQSEEGAGINAAVSGLSLKRMSDEIKNIKADTQNKLADQLVKQETAYYLQDQAANARTQNSILHTENQIKKEMLAEHQAMGSWWRKLNQGKVGDDLKGIQTIVPLLRMILK